MAEIETASRRGERICICGHAESEHWTGDLYDECHFCKWHPLRFTDEALVGGVRIRIFKPRKPRK